MLEEKTPLAELPERLRQRTHVNFHARVFLRSDQNLSYRVVMQVMNVMQDAGFYKVGLVAEEIETASESR